MNVFFVSDHGMESVTRKNIIDLREFVSDNMHDTYGKSPVYHIYPNKGTLWVFYFLLQTLQRLLTSGAGQDVYNALKTASDNGENFKVYRLSEIPERWHYKHNRRLPPILVVADPPFVFQDFYDSIVELEKKWNITGKSLYRFLKSDNN